MYPIIAKISIDLILAIILVLALVTTHEEATKRVHYITIAIAVLTTTACVCWWYI